MLICCLSHAGAVAQGRFTTEVKCIKKKNKKSMTQMCDWESSEKQLNTMFIYNFCVCDEHVNKGYFFNFIILKQEFACITFIISLKRSVFQTLIYYMIPKHFTLQTHFISLEFIRIQLIRMGMQSSKWSLADHGLCSQNSL